jgi:predicted site-specific integrase-resolvase
MNLISKKELKNWLGISDPTLWRWIDEGYIKPIKPFPTSTKTFYDKDEVEKVIIEGTFKKKRINAKSKFLKN